VGKGRGGGGFCGVRGVGGVGVGGEVGGGAGASGGGGKGVRIHEEKVKSKTVQVEKQDCISRGAFLRHPARRMYKACRTLLKTRL